MFPHYKRKQILPVQKWPHTDIEPFSCCRPTAQASVLSFLINSEFKPFLAFKKANDIFKLYHNCCRLEAHKWLTASKFLMHMLWKYEVNSLLWHAVESKCLYFIHTWESRCLHRMLTHSCWGGAEQDSSSNTLLFAKVSESFKAMKESLFPNLFWLGRFYPYISINGEWKEKFCLITAFLVKEAMCGISRITVLELNQQKWGNEHKRGQREKFR